MSGRQWLTTIEAAHYLRFDTCRHPRREFVKWVHRHGVPFARRGRVLLFDVRDLDDAIAVRDRVADQPPLRLRR